MFNAQHEKPVIGHEEICFFLFYFEQYLFRVTQFREAGLNGALTKRKNNTKNNNR